ncbi:MAG: XRE family transcriptional regulator [bacterium]|nr:XRE family transcriptional regulator [bacterium]
MNRIKEARLKKNFKQADLAANLNVKQNTLSNWETGRTEPDIESLRLMAKLLETSVGFLVGNDEELGTVRIPVLGSVPAGIPLEAIEDIIDWEEIPKSMATGDKEYFALEVKGDSMWPDYLPGDVVIVRKQPTCDSGEDCIVYVNGYDATLKQVRLNSEDQSLTIVPRNQSYPPRTFTAEEIQNLPVTIAGVVVELRRKIKK